MATLDEMFRALEAADAAGASDDARELAKMIQQASSKTPEVKPQTGFIPSVIRGGRQLSSLIGDVAPAMIA
jgi:hypothetical protein